MSKAEFCIEVHEVHNNITIPRNVTNYSAPVNGLLDIIFFYKSVSANKTLVNFFYKLQEM